MPGIHLYSSNRLEVLAGIFAELVQAEPLPPFEKEIVLTQSRGMERWLALESASRANIWANCYCPFPNAFVHKIYKLLFPHIPETSPYIKEYILYHLMDIIPTLINDPQFHQVAAYLASDTNDDLKLYQLSYEMADLFDQYTLFRPDMIMNWSAGTIPFNADHAWQAILWSRLVEHLYQLQKGTDFHRARLLQLFEQKISTTDFDHGILPSRVSVFGISSLPPYHLRVLAALAQHIDLYFFIMNPCREYWFDIIADRDIVQITRREAVSQDKLHFSQGNSLLASMGHLGRDFMAMVQELYTDEHELFVAPAEDTLLSAIQHDILNLNEFPDVTGESSSHKKKINDYDISLTFHSCHSPMREVEILYDHLLDIFDANTKAGIIEPRDVLVMAPAIDDYAPLIRAIFDAPISGRKKIPYSISDQSIIGQSKYIATFLEILQIPRSRCTSVDIIGILAAAAVKKRFGISDRDLAILEEWLRQTRICWGINPKHKARLQLPPYRENTWVAGLDRLLLGYAMPGYDNILFNEILPYDAVEGNNTYLLGSFLDFSETLFSLAETLQQSYSLADWSEILLQAKDKLMVPDTETESDDRALHQLLYKLRELQQSTSFIRKVSLEVVRAYLKNALDGRFTPASDGKGFLTGGVTFCSMLPMRAIPFKAIYLLGMNDGMYPRAGRKKSFDIMADTPKRGDRSQRYDDRYLFLETILSARKRLTISFVGQSIQDGGRRPPSSLVSELMDYIDRGYRLDTKHGDSTAALSTRLTTMHHLQPFHPAYFAPRTDTGPQDLFSYSAENCAAARALMKEKIPATQHFPEPPQPTQITTEQVDFQQLVHFFSHPARYLLVRKIGISSLEENELLETSEHFTLKGLARYKMENDILAYMLQNRDYHELYRIKQAAGELPHGEVGKTYFARMVSELQSFHKILTDLFADRETIHQQVNLVIGDCSITGRLAILNGSGLVQYRYGKLQAKDVIRSWISHLILLGLQDNMTLTKDMTTYWAGKDTICRYRPAAEWKHYLEELLKLYQRGLTAPLPFFPQTSYVFAKESFKNKHESAALQKARTAWEGDHYGRKGEKNDPYYRLCGKNLDPDAPSFTKLANAVFLPALAHMEKIGTANFTAPI